MFSPKKSTDLFYLSILVGFWVIFHFRVLFGGHTFVMEDAASVFYPLWKWGSDVFHRGFLPLWNPDAAFGTPYLADPEMAVWYPPVRLFYSLFPAVAAFNLTVVCHHLSALAGFWVFARGRGFSQPASLSGALWFGFPISIVGFTWDPAMLLSFSWIPWIFWSWDRLRTRRPGAFLPFSFLLAMQMASGYPVISYLTLLALALEWAAAAFLEKAHQGPTREDWLKRTGMAASALGLAAAFNLAWVLPFLEFKGLSNINRRLEMPQSLPLESLVTWLNPFYAGNPLHHFNPIPFWVYSFFMGIPALVALFWGLLKGRPKRIPFAFLSLWVFLAMGSTLVVGDWVKRLLPFYGWVARSGCLLSLVFFYAAKLAAQASAEMIEGKTGKKIEWSWVILASFLFFSAFLWGTPLDLWTAWGAFFLCAAAAFKGFFPIGARWALLSLSIILSLGPADQNVNFTLEKAYYREKPKILESMDQPGRIYVSPQLADSYGAVSSSSVRENREDLKQSLMPNGPLAYGREEVSYANPLLLNSFLRWYLLDYGNNPSEKLMDYLDVRYRVDPGPFFQWKSPVGDGKGIRVWENPNPLSKWFSVEQALPQPEWNEARQALRAPAFDFSKTCFWEGTGQPAKFEPRQIKEISRTPNRVDLTAEGRGPALLASSETAYPGWQVRIGGKTTLPDVVNFDFRGVFLEAGENRATLVYDPATFRLGCFISIFVCGIWAFLAFVFFIKNRTPSDA